VASERELENLHEPESNILCFRYVGVNGKREEGSGKRDNDDVLFPAVARIREVAEGRGTTIEMLAIGTALARPWADVVLTGAATVGQIQSNVAALELAYDPELEEELRSVSIDSTEYWRARSSFRWN